MLNQRVAPAEQVNPPAVIQEGIMIVIDQNKFGWNGKNGLPSLAYKCGYCGNKVSSVNGYKAGLHHDGSGQQIAAIYICPHCGGPTFRDTDGNHLPGVPFGSSVSHVPEELEKIYDEARRCTSNSSFTAAVLLARKILMHIGVDQGAEEGKSFLHYINYLAEKGFVPPNGKHWVDHIRKKGNEANHEIVIMNKQDANDLILFIEMLLKFIYEFPNMVPNP
jgi:DNA-directed RNA polymerase subunit RPC12/RpoP